MYAMLFFDNNEIEQQYLAVIHLCGLVKRLDLLEVELNARCQFLDGLSNPLCVPYSMARWKRSHLSWHSGHFRTHHTNWFDVYCLVIHLCCSAADT